MNRLFIIGGRLLSAYIDHELRVMWILEGYVKEYQTIYPDNETIDTGTLKRIEKIATENGGIVNMCGNFSASVLYPFAAIRETSVCGYQCQGFPRSGACTLDTDIHICYNF